MDIHSVLSLIFYSIPVVTTFSSLLLLLMSYQDKDSPFSGELRFVGLSFFCMSFLASLGIMIYPYSAQFFAAFTPLHYGALISVPIILYHLIWKLTPGVNKKKTFPLKHFIFPILFSLLLGIWFLFIPQDVRIALAKNREIVVTEYEVFSVIFHSRMQVRLVVNLVYFIFIFLRIRAYWLTIKKDDHKEVKATKKWVKILVALSFTTFIASLLGAFQKGTTPYFSILAFATILVLSALHIELIFRLIKGYFPSIEEERHKKIRFRKKIKSQHKIKESGKITNKKQFEKWFNKNKPYLDSTFTLNDLSTELGVNRTYISKFINTTYGVSFTTYINEYRLKELERLMKLTSNKKKTPVDLYSEAGFGSYRSYLRVKSLKNKSIE